MITRDVGISTKWVHNILHKQLNIKLLSLKCHCSQWDRVVSSNDGLQLSDVKEQFNSGLAIENLHQTRWKTNPTFWIIKTYFSLNAWKNMNYYIYWTSHNPRMSHKKIPFDRNEAIIYSIANVITKLVKFRFFTIRGLPVLPDLSF